MVDNGTPFADDVSPHVFRHTYATMLFYAGVDMKAAQYLLGHSSATTTLEIYTHLDKSKVFSNVEKINNFIESSQDEYR
jgi:site-specific recombinase XerD